jgi:hypothetical protein
VIGSPFSLRFANESEQIFDPEESLKLAPLLLLLFRPVQLFKASSEGQAILIFSDGAELSIKPDERYEAWESHGTQDLADASLLCPPGGGSPWG